MSTNGQSMTLFGDELKVINLGLEDFADNLRGKKYRWFT